MRHVALTWPGLEHGPDPKTCVSRARPCGPPLAPAISSAGPPQPPRFIRRLNFLVIRVCHDPFRRKTWGAAAIQFKVSQVRQDTGAVVDYKRGQQPPASRTTAGRSSAEDQPRAGACSSHRREYRPGARIDRWLII